MSREILRGPLQFFVGIAERSSEADGLAGYVGRGTRISVYIRV